MMGKGRLEAFSDGVLAIIITIMVLELHAPHLTDFHALIVLWPIFLSYVLSFLYVGIYWNNHHHLFLRAHRVNAAILWANLHLLFWLSLIPFSTSWMGENHLAILPTALYGVILLMAAVAYLVLQLCIRRNEGHGSVIAQAIGKNVKGMLSIILYVTGIGLSLVLPWLAQAVYVGVALMWLVPDRRIENSLREHV